MHLPLDIDGSMGEGGGQVLRSALSLAMLSGRPFQLHSIRANRDRPGLRPQHLAAVRAAAMICGAAVEGDVLGSRELHFVPGRVQHGSYRFDIGTAGATALVLQTLLPPLALAAGPSQLQIRGGTHVPWSPCYHYLDWQWRVLLGRAGMPFELQMPLAGFYPQGGGRLQANIPGHARPRALRLSERGPIRRLRGLSAVARLPIGIAERQREEALRRLRPLLELDPEIELQELSARSPGSLLILLAEFEQGRACYFGLGARGKPAEQVAAEAVAPLAAFLRRGGAIDAWLADQLLLPLALADSASLLHSDQASSHLRTNAQVIDRFLPVGIGIRELADGSAMVAIEPGSPGPGHA